MMELFAAIAPVVAPVFLIPLIGFIWVKRKIAFDQNMATEVGVLFATPCLVFSTISVMELPADGLGPIILATIICLLGFAAAGWIILKAFRLSIRIYLPSLIFANTGTLGLPVCLFAFGEKGLALAMIYMAVCLVGQLTIGSAITAAKFEWTAFLKQPFLLALIAAIVVNMGKIDVPQWVANTTMLAGGISVPIMLMSMGVALGELRVRHFRRAFFLALLRVVGGGLLGWLVGLAFNFDKMMIGIMVIQSFMPTAILNYLFARMSDSEPDEVASVVMLSTLLSLALLPFVVALVI